MLAQLAKMHQNKIISHWIQESYELPHTFSSLWKRHSRQSLVHSLLHQQNEIEKSDVLLAVSHQYFNFVNSTPYRYLSSDDTSLYMHCRSKSAALERLVGRAWLSLKPKPLLPTWWCKPFQTDIMRWRTIRKGLIYPCVEILQFAYFYRCLISMPYWTQNNDK